MLSNTHVFSFAKSKYSPSSGSSSCNVIEGERKASRFKDMTEDRVGPGCLDSDEICRY